MANNNFNTESLDHIIDDAAWKCGILTNVPTLVREATTLFENFMPQTMLDSLLCYYKGLPKDVNYMIKD